jgi:hypothetical protein
VINGNTGLLAHQPEMTYLIPVIQVRYEPEYVLVTIAGELDYAAVSWPGRPGGPPSTGPPGSWSAPGARPGGCSGSPGWIAWSRWPGT